MGLRALLAACLLALAVPVGATAQEAPARVQSPILTIDVDRLLGETRFGQRLQDDLRERTEALAAENERLRAELTAEERSLTERRPTMEVDAFRSEADAFDVRVQRIRAEQDAKQQALEASVEEGRQEFLTTVTPVLGRLMIERGAAVILQRRDVFLSASAIDVTEAAIAAINAQLGDGTGGPSEGPAPLPEAPAAEPEPPAPSPAEPEPAPEVPALPAPAPQPSEPGLSPADGPAAPGETAPVAPGGG
jgi:Skp family chaperone for outer membrane proteins